MGKKDAALHSTPIAHQRKVLGDSEVHQTLNHAHKDHKQRTVTRKQTVHSDLPQRVKAGEVAYPFGIWGKIFAVVTFVLFIAACLYWIVQFATPRQ